MFTERVFPIILTGCFIVCVVYKSTDVYNAHRQIQLLFYKPNGSNSSTLESLDETRPRCAPLVTNFKFLKPTGNEAFLMDFTSSLNYRQACSIESLALTNPNLTINVLMTADPIDFTSTTMSVLRNYSNVNIVPIAPADFFMGTPLEHWFFRTDWFTSQYAIEHLSDALRYITLYKYGGYYFDLDVIVMRLLASYRNFSASQGGEVAIGAMHFDYNHPVILDLVEEFRVSYNKNYWSHAGPGAITRVLKKYCQVEALDDALTDGAKPCKNFTIFTPESFYPIHYSNWEQYFNNETDALLAQWDRTKVMGAHVWNKLSAGQPVYKHSRQLYSELARLYCPAIFSAAPEPF